MDHTGLGVEPQSAALRLAVEGDPLISPLPVLQPIERGPQGGREGARIQLAEEPVQRRLTGVVSSGKPSAESRSLDWRAPHSAMARTEVWAHNRAATVSARTAGRE